MSESPGRAFWLCHEVGTLSTLLVQADKASAALK
jgi:hypothetical protein